MVNYWETTKSQRNKKVWYIKQAINKTGEVWSVAYAAQKHVLEQSHFKRDCSYWN
jgi:hypothetical protein